MATTSFGQTNWKNIVTNGDCEADVPAYTDYTTMPADAWNSFWYQYGNEGTAAKGTAEIVSGVGVDGSRCVKVVTRTKAEGEANQLMVVRPNLYLGIASSLFIVRNPCFKARKFV